MWLPATAITASEGCFSDGSALTHNITTFFGENQWPGTTKFCLKIMWTAVPVSLNKCADHFSCAATQFLVINAAPASRAMRKATAIASE